MSIQTILGTLTVRPVQLLFDVLCSLLTRMSLSPGAAILCMSLFFCLIATPLRPKQKPDGRKEWCRTGLVLLVQGLVLIASIRWFTGLRAFRGASFGPIRDLGGTNGLILFWGGYAVFAVLRALTGWGYTPMKMNTRQLKTNRNNIILLVLSCLYMAILTGLLIPSALIGASPAEFVDAHYYHNPARYLLSSALLASGTFLFWGILYGMLLSPRARKRLTLFMAICVASAAVNYMFFGKDYGFISSALQYETAITNRLEKTLINTGCVLAAAAAVFFLLRKKRSLILRILCLYGCAALAVMSVINISGMEKKAGEVRDITDRIKAEDASFRLDREGRNVIVIMMDRAIGSFVPYLMNEKPELKEQFDGFTYYPNSLSYGYHTNIASPALYGGYEYTPDGLEERAELSLKDKHNEALKIMPLNFLDAGYEVTVCDASYANYQWIPDMSIFDEYPDIRTYNTIGMFDEYKVQMLENLDRNRNRNIFFYSLFRSAPLLLQETLYDQGRYLEMDAKADKGKGSELIGVSPDFLNNYMVMKNLGTLTRVTEEGKNTFLLLSNEMTHDVIELQEPDYTPGNNVDNTAYEAEHGVRRTEDGKELDISQADEIVRIHYQSDMAAFIQLGKWFDELRAQGVWDNTRIILVSDHGCYLGLTGVNLADRVSDESVLGRYLAEEWTDTTCYNPLLMVKDFGATGFITDTAFMTNAETPGLAFEGTIDHPVNPFTGKTVTREAENLTECHIVESDWHIVTNCGNTFTDPLRITFRNKDIFDPENWSVEQAAEQAETVEK